MSEQKQFPRMVTVRIEDISEPSGYYPLMAALISPQIACTVQFGSMEILRVKATTEDDVYDFVASSEPLVFAEQRKGYSNELLQDATSLTFAEFVEKHPDLFI